MNLEVSPQIVDVSAYEAVEGLADAAEQRFGKVHVLCNNAGVSGGGGGGPRPIWAQGQKDWDWVMGVNFWGVVNGLRAFTPRMIAHGEEGHIVNTSSILGLTTGAGSIYGVSKHAVARLTEGLYWDLKNAEAKIGVTLLCPGMIATNIITSARNRPAKRWWTRPAQRPRRARRRGHGRPLQERGHGAPRGGREGGAGHA